MLAICLPGNHVDWRWKVPAPSFGGLEEALAEELDGALAGKLEKALAGELDGAITDELDVTIAGELEGALAGELNGGVSLAREISRGMNDD